MLLEDLLFDFCDAGSQSKINVADKNVPRKAESVTSKTKGASSKGKKKQGVVTKKTKKSVNRSMSTVNDTTLKAASMQEESSVVDPSELSIEPTKLKRLDLASIVSQSQE